MQRVTLIEAAQLAGRAAAAASLALVLAGWLRLEFPIYAFLAAIIVTDLSSGETRRLGWRRLVATFVGATCGATFAQLLPNGIPAIGCGVLLTMLICSLIRMQQAAKVGGYICGIIQIAFVSDPWTYAYYRLLETILGIAIAWGISLIPRMIRTEEAKG